MKSKSLKVLLVVVVALFTIIFATNYYQLKVKCNEEMQGERVASFYKATVKKSYKENDNIILVISYNGINYQLIVDENTNLNDKKDLVENLEIGYQITATCFFHFADGNIDNGWGTKVFPATDIR